MEMRPLKQWTGLPQVLGMAVVLLAVSATFVACSTQPEPGATNEPSSGTVPEDVTDAEAAAAEAALRDSGLIESLNGNQPWDVDYYTSSRSGTKKIGAYLVVSWAEDVSSDGPWVALNCRGTERIERRVLWHDLRARAVIISLDDHSVLSILPGAAENSNPYVGQRGEVRSYPDPEQAEDLPPLPDCPPGMEDD